MKTLKQFVPQLFADYSDNLDHITEVQGKLSSVSAKSSSFQNVVSVAKLVNVQTNASKFSVNIFDSLSTIVDYDFEYTTTQLGKDHFDHNTENEKDECSEAANYLIGLLVQKLGNGTTQEIGYYNGVPIYCFVQQVPKPQYIMYSSSGIIRLYFGRKAIDSQYTYTDPFLTIRFLPDQYSNATTIRIESRSLTKEDPWSFVGDAYVEGSEIDEWYVGHIDTIINSIINSYVSNECVSSIIQRAQTDGVVTRDQVESILNQYGSTNLGENIRSLIAGTGRLDSISLITLIGKLYDKMGASYDDENQTETFSVYDSPNFITSIIQMVLNVVIVATAVILTLVFRVIGVVVSLLLTVVSTVVSMIQQNITKTNARVINTSLTPVIDNPLLTIQLTPSQMSTWISRYWNDTSLDDLNNILDTYGCAMVSPQYTGSAPYYYWILPRTNKEDPTSTYTIQLLISVNSTRLPQSFEVANITVNPGSFAFEEDIPGYHRVYASNLVSGLSDSGSSVSTRDGVVDTEYSYLKFSEDDDNYQLRRTINTNLIKALCDLFTNSSDMLVKPFGKIYVADPSGDDSFSIVSSTGFDPEDYYIDASKCTITQLLKLVNNGLNSSAFTTLPILKVVLFTVLYSKYSRMLAAQVADVAPPTWDELTSVFEFVRSFSGEVPGYINTKSGVYTNARLKYDNLFDGHTLATPAVEWPSLSKSALIKALVVSGVTIAAIAGIAVTVKVGLKKVAFNKLASRQASYKEAEDAYQKMKSDIAADKENMGGYSKQQIKQITKNYYRANNKLTRAWSFAGKFGLSMFNGFSTGSTDAAFADDPTSSVLSDFKSNYFNSNNSDPFDDVNIQDVDLSVKIYNAIV